MFFMAILIVFVFSFGTAYQANLFPNAVPSWKLLQNIVYMPYWQIFGDPALDNAEGMYLLTTVKWVIYTIC